MDVFGRNDMQLLANLLSESEKDHDLKVKPKIAELNPASIIDNYAKKPDETNEPTLSVPKKPSTEIWDEDEVPIEGYVDESDTRTTPLYDIVYKQAVTPHDIYLGISGNTPSVMSCEDMLVKIMLPDTKGSDIAVETTETSLDVRTPKFKLLLPLEHSIKREHTKAKWEAEKELLVVTLPLAREKLELL